MEWCGVPTWGDLKYAVGERPAGNDPYRVSIGLCVWEPERRFPKLLPETLSNPDWKRLVLGDCSPWTRHSAAFASSSFQMMSRKNCRGWPPVSTRCGCRSRPVGRVFGLRPICPRSCRIHRPEDRRSSSTDRVCETNRISTTTAQSRRYRWSTSASAVRATLWSVNEG